MRAFKLRTSHRIFNVEIGDRLQPWEMSPQRRLTRSSKLCIGVEDSRVRAPFSLIATKPNIQEIRPN